MATLHDISKRAGVSYETVSRVLNRGEVGTRSDAVRRAKRIQRIASELGYRPNSSARAMREGRTHSIGLLLASQNAHAAVASTTLFPILNALMQHGQRLVVGQLTDELLSSDDQLPQVLSEWTVDGLLIGYTHHLPSHMMRIIKQHRVPAVWLNNKLDADCVYPDDFGAAREATEQLLQRGHQRILYIGHTQHHYSTQERRDGYQSAMTQAGLTPHLIESSATEEDALGLEEQVRQILYAPDRPTAIVTYSSPLAMSAYLAARSLGLRVPDDLSYVTFDHRASTPWGVKFTWMKVPVEQVGEMAVERVMHLIDSPHGEMHPEAQPIPMKFCPGQTIAPVPKP